MSSKDEWGLTRRETLNYEQKNRGVIYKYILGSAFAASFVEAVIFFVITIIWFVIFDLALEPAYTTLFPISPLYQTVIFFVITFTASLFIGNQQNLYQDLIRLYARVLGNTNTLAAELCFSLKARRLEAPVLRYFRYTNESGDPVVKISDTFTVKQVYRDLNEILRSIVLAQRFEHRTRFEDARDKRTHYNLDRSNTVSGLDIDQLPMQPHLKAEILRYAPEDGKTNGLADQMWDMVYKRLRVLGTQQGATIEEQMIFPQLMQGMDRQMSSLTTDTAEIIAIKSLRVLSIIIYFLIAAVYVFCFSIAWQLWGAYGWVGLIAAALIIWFALALYRVGFKLTDPFASWNNSSYVWIDMTRMAVNTAREIDEIFDRLFEQMEDGAPAAKTVGYRTGSHFVVSLDTY